MRATQAFNGLKMGGFHAACTFLGVSGKRFRDGSLKNLAMEAGITGQRNAE